MTIGHTLIGDGPEKVVVAHGWFDDHTVFSPMFPYLDGGRFAYAFMDYRGYGKSRAVAGEHTIAEMAGDAIELADALGWRSFHVVGHSMGGKVVQRIAVDAPGRVRSIVGITPVAASAMPLDEETYGFFEAATKDEGVAKQLIGVSLGNRTSAAFVEWLWRRTKETATSEAFAAHLPAFVKTDFAEAAKALKVPILVLVGAYDEGLTEDYARAAYPPLYPHARIEVLPATGHYPMQETPVHLAKVIEDFLAENAAA